MKYTPGPWKAQADDYGYWGVYDKDDNCIAEAAEPDNCYLEDIQLMAAAPEMYELLLAVAANPTTNYSSKIADLLWRIKGDEDEEEDEE